MWITRLASSSLVLAPYAAMCGAAARTMLTSEYELIPIASRYALRLVSMSGLAPGCAHARLA